MPAVSCLRVGVLILALLMSGCRCARLGDAKTALANNKPEFNEIAGSLIRQSAIRELYRFSEDEFRCNDAHVKVGAAGAFAIKTSRRDVSGRTFDEVASECGVSSGDLRAELERFRKLAVYGATIEMMGKTKWVNILLSGSGWAPWGFRYVKPDRPDDIAYFRKLAKAGGFHRDVCFRELGDGWFHFESDR